MRTRASIRNEGKIPMSNRRKWLNFRRDILPTLFFSSVVLFTFLFWKMYLSPIEYSAQEVQASSGGFDYLSEIHFSTGNNHKVNPSIGFIK